MGLPTDGASGSFSRVSFAPFVKQQKGISHCHPQLVVSLYYIKHDRIRVLLSFLLATVESSVNALNAYSKMFRTVLEP